MQMVEKLYSDNFGAIRDFARKLCNNPSDVEDLIQESFLRITKSIDKLKDINKSVSWIFTTIRRTHIDLWRRRTEYGRLDISSFRGEYDDFCFDDKSHDQKVTFYSNGQLITNEKLNFLQSIGAVETENFNEKHEKLNQEIEKLDEKQRIVIKLFYYDGLSLKEISKRLDLTEINVKLRLFRGRENLRKLLT